MFLFQIIHVDVLFSSNISDKDRFHVYMRPVADHCLRLVRMMPCLAARLPCSKCLSGAPASGGRQGPCMWACVPAAMGARPHEMPASVCVRLAAACWPNEWQRDQCLNGDQPADRTLIGGDRLATNLTEGGGPTCQ